MAVGTPEERFEALPGADTDRSLLPQQVAWLVGGVFVLLSLPISVSEGAAPQRSRRDVGRTRPASPRPRLSTCPRPVYQHLTHFEQPELQTYIVRILWMVPVYGIESWFSLRYFRLSIYMATLRELCERPLHAHAASTSAQFQLSLRRSRRGAAPGPAGTRRTSSTASSPFSSSTSAARKRCGLHSHYPAACGARPDAGRRRGRSSCASWPQNRPRRGSTSFPSAASGPGKWAASSSSRPRRGPCNTWCSSVRAACALRFSLAVPFSLAASPPLSTRRDLHCHLHLPVAQRVRRRAL